MAEQTGSTTTLYNYTTGVEEAVPSDLVTQFVASGNYALPKGERVPIVDEFGRTGTIDGSEAHDAFTKGNFVFQTPAMVQEQELQKKFGESPYKAGLAGAARGATFGLSDVALTKSGLVDPETLKQLEERNPEASLAGEVAGAAGSLLVPGLGEANLAKVGLKSTSLAARGIKALTALPRAAKESGAIAKAALEARGMTPTMAKALGSAVEGAYYGAGQVVSEKALGDSELSAENIMSDLGKVMLGAGLGAGVSAAGSVLGKGIEKATPYAEKASNWVSQKATHGYARVASKFTNAEAQDIAMLMDNPFTDLGMSVRKAVVGKDTTDLIRNLKARYPNESPEKIKSVVEGLVERAQDIKKRPLDDLTTGVVGGFLGERLLGEAFGTFGLGAATTLAAKKAIENPKAAATALYFIERATDMAKRGALKLSDQTLGKMSSGVLLPSLLQDSDVPEEDKNKINNVLTAMKDQVLQKGEQTDLKGQMSTLAQIEKNNSRKLGMMDSSLNNLFAGKPVELPKEELPRQKALAAYNLWSGRLNQLSNSDILQEHLDQSTSRLTDAAPNTRQALQLKIQNAIGFLDSKLPRNPSEDPDMLFKRKWEPNDQDLFKFNKYAKYTEDPWLVFRDMDKGELSPEGVETLKTVYPLMYDKMRELLIDKLSNNQDIPYSRRLQIGMLLGQPVDVGMSPNKVLALQSSYTAQPSQKGQPRKMDMNTERWMTDTQKLISKG